MEPDFEAPFEHFTLSYMSQYGELYIDWKRLNSKIKLKIPVGVRAILRLYNKELILGSGEYEF
ncbi:alpha-L-rhamnosidase C-terminal domain-containing protein [Caloramator sp. E03]|uniref:alpha-L-rhamnosidase C-terminal domain-containing protein n=1 Tax=Caloramator sp. E03 TaxID=2576307 RepID=UPI002110344D|nr:alpha-L-rhamnosidase C-terminal domain-containing protein [Caloramator sp. E03]